MADKEFSNNQSNLKLWNKTGQSKQRERLTSTYSHSRGNTLVYDKSDWSPANTETGSSEVLWGQKWQVSWEKCYCCSSVHDDWHLMVILNCHLRTTGWQQICPCQPGGGSPSTRPACQTRSYTQPQQAQLQETGAWCHNHRKPNENAAFKQLKLITWVYIQYFWRIMTCVVCRAGFPPAGCAKQRQRYYENTSTAALIKNASCR